MADKSRSVWKLKRGIYSAAEFGEVTVSQNDTVTFSSLFATANPYTVTFVTQADGAAMTCTYSAGTNVATVTGAGTNVRCLYMAYGIKA